MVIEENVDEINNTLKDSKHSGCNKQEDRFAGTGLRKGNPTFKMKANMNG